MNQNYYCNGKWFPTYMHARVYADDMRDVLNLYYVIYTKAEMDSIINAIDHELECGK